MTTTQNPTTGLFVTELTSTVVAEYVNGGNQNTAITLYRQKVNGDYVAITLNSRAEDALLAILLGRKGIVLASAAEVVR
jgi:CelD/BcsL family acetyltransferase involved in cellulose biosynthesis